MAEQMNADARGQATTGKALRRRGLIAGAAALVAGMVAKRAAEDTPVAADGDVWTFPYFGSTSYTGTAFSVTNTGGRGIYGASYAGHAVYGQIFGAGGGTAGVHGNGNGNDTYGVHGANSFAGYGVYGSNSAAGGTGVRGEAQAGFPMVGVATGGTNANAGVLGIGTAGPGVQGQSTAGHGVVGLTGTTDGHAALFGYTNHSGGIAVRGSVDSTVRSAPYTFAGVFDGTVAVAGNLYIGGSKSAYVKHPDGSDRLLYCVESPESWFEDFGTGTLVGGQAAVKLDPDFAALVDTSKMHVFLTAYGNTNGLHVTAQTAAGFTVEEHNGGRNSLAFSYRVVAKRKDITGKRLAKFAPPPAMKPVAAFAVPETHKEKPQEKKP